MKNTKKNITNIKKDLKDTLISKGFKDWGYYGSSGRNVIMMIRLDKEDQDLQSLDQWLNRFDCIDLIDIIKDEKNEIQTIGRNKTFEIHFWIPNGF